MGRSQTTRPGGALARGAGTAVGAVLAGVAKLRGGKAVHPDGVVHRARLSLPGTPAAAGRAPLFTEPGEHDAIVRFSRSLGVPRPIPDLLGMTIRLTDLHGPGRHQDFLLVTSVDRPVLHHLFVPASDAQQRPYSSSLPYSAGRERFIVGVLPHSASPRPPGENEFDRLAAAAATGALRFHLAVASIGGRFQPVGELTIGARMPPAADATHFNPFNTGPGFEPVGFLNRMRDPAYRMSQRAWSGAPR